MQPKPFPIPPTTCFLAGAALPLLFSGMSTPMILEYQTVGNAFVSSLINGSFSALIFWFAFNHRKEALYPLFCVTIGGIIGSNASMLFHDFDLLFVVVRLVLTLVVAGSAYQYIARKLKK